MCFIPRLSHRIPRSLSITTERLLATLPASQLDAYLHVCQRRHQVWCRGIDTQNARALLAAFVPTPSNRCQSVPSWIGSIRTTLFPTRFCSTNSRRYCTFGRGRQVQTGSVQAAISAVGKTIELAGLWNPLNKAGTTNYHAALMMQMESYKREDPATIKQLAVPTVDVPNYIYRTMNVDWVEHALLVL